MDDFIKALVKASVAWLAVGVVLGVAMAIVSEWTVYRAMHVQVMLVGFVTMFVNGVGYHVVPKLSWRPLWSVRAARRHGWIANSELFAMIAGFWLHASGSPVATGALSEGGLISAGSAIIFGPEVWLTVGAPPRGAGAARGSSSAGAARPVIRRGQNRSPRDSRAFDPSALMRDHMVKK